MRLLLLVLSLSSALAASPFTFRSGFSGGASTNGLLTDLYGWLEFDEASGGLVWTHTPSPPPINSWVENTSPISTNIGVEAGSREFDGTDCFFLLSDELFSQIDSDYTFSGWINLASLTGDQALFGVWNPANSLQRQWRVYFDDDATDVFRFDVSTGGGANVVSASVAPASPITTGTWYFVCVWVDDTANTMNIVAEADGGSLPTPGSTALTDPVDNVSFSNMIGAVGTSASPSMFISNGGMLDLFGFWHTALTSDQRNALYGKITYGAFD